ncbi:MAG: hydantoinase/oxoprolinase family protein [Gemmatimonadaceae bacterium]
MSRWVGVDVGGTYTDLAAVDEEGRVEARKVPSTPADQSVGVEDALLALGSSSGLPRDVTRLVHGTTVATNTLLERSGARVVLCATEGFTDLLELRRQNRASLYDLTAHHEPALVARDATVGVPERITPGAVVRPLTDDDAVACAAAAASRAPEVVAVSLLHAYADRRHEDKLARSLEEGLPPGVDVVCSSDVFPEIREFERTATTVAEAYLRPAVARYLGRLAARLAAANLPALGVMTSSGGMRDAAEAARGAASLALSGPAGGVVGAAAVLRAAGFPRALTIDIGGTSADVGLILDGEPLVEPGGAVAGVPIALPRVLVETVSAGGGSIAWVDDGGALRVGPRSAGVSPGPAAFGRGGTQATVTDAHVVLGHITAGRFSGGVALDVGAARRAIDGLAANLGAPSQRVAAAVVATVDASMARALRRVSVERGIDPRTCVLVAFGGGGPLHGCGLAERVGVTRVLVPPFAGVLSALGLAVAAERREAMASLMRGLASLETTELRTALHDVRERAGAASDKQTQWWLRARYAGQGHELDVPVAIDDGPAALGARFAQLHVARFGFTLERPVELVSVRCAVSGTARPLRLSRLRGPATSSNTEDLHDSGGPLDSVVRGPATITLPDATLHVKPGWVARSLDLGGWMLEREIA